MKFSVIKCKCVNETIIQQPNNNNQHSTTMLSSKDDLDNTSMHAYKIINAVRMKRVF